MKATKIQKRIVDEIRQIGMADRPPRQRMTKTRKRAPKLRQTAPEDVMAKRPKARRRLTKRGATGAVSARRDSVRLGLHDEHANVGDHIAYFWETPQEFREGVRFLEVGLDEGDFCVIFGHDEGNKQVLETLTQRGHDCVRLEAQRRLAFLRGDTDAAKMLSNIRRTFTDAIKSGATLIRLLGNIGWGREGWPNENDILEFEARVTGAAKAFPCVVVCMYAVRALPGHVMVHGAFETHPLTFCGNVMRHNTHYVEASQFLARQRKREKTS